MFAPDVQPLAMWLVDSGRLPKNRLSDVLEDTKDPGEYILRIVYDALPEGAREAGRKLQVNRAPSRLNGGFGEFRWADEPTKALDVNRVDVATLQRVGLLGKDDTQAPADLVMPRLAREMFALHARALEPELVRTVHEGLSLDPGFDNLPKEQQIEVHHHAARAGNLERTRQTALYYGFELRPLATQLSRMNHDHDGAAKLFRELVTHFDADDAYAWEYLGYNLALADKSARQSGKRAAEILEAYEHAHRLDGKNPLYHGRYLGYRAERDMPISSEVRRALQYYAERSDAGNFVSWFIMPVLDGLRRAGRNAERSKLIAEWRALFEWCAPRVLEKHSEGNE